MNFSRFILVLLFLQLSCSSAVHKDNTNFQSPRSVAQEGSASPALETSTLNSKASQSLPELIEWEGGVSSIQKTLKRGRQIEEEKLIQYSKVLAKYMSFLGISKNKKSFQPTLNRLLNSSTQFLFCEDFEDWECLEKTPPIRPTLIWRQEASEDLGKPVNIDSNFKMKYFFTEQWDRPIEQTNPDDFLAKKLAALIESQKWDSLSLGLYGIDDIENSMKPVYEAIIKQNELGAEVKAVVDADGIDKATKNFPLIFTHVPGEFAKPSIFSKNSKDRSNVVFEYKGTVDLLKALNKGIKSDQNSKARIEWPDAGIMHNKFIVFEKNKELSVWTGTANISQTCMGTERNTNVSIYIENTEVASAFKTEFDEMFGFRNEPFVDYKKRLVNREGKFDLPVGRFHNDKRPNTFRYFKFKDGHEVRVHFSPTDDAEHRVIIPTLLSARKGDQIRIAMFGGGGMELVRAMQFAAAQGAELKIVFDKVTGAGNGSWINNLEANLKKKNPYTSKNMGSIEVRMSQWPKLNHHKTMTLTRENGGKYHAELAIVGSQNWSVSGNDLNDENIVTIRNHKKDVDFVMDFNKHFDEKLWPASKSGQVQIEE